MENVTPPAAEGHGASLRAARADGAGEELTRQERAHYRDAVLEQTGGDWLKFQAQAVRRYGAAGGIMCREILFWDDKGDDPSGGWIYMTKRGPKQSCEYRTGLTPKSQDGGRRRLEDAGVLQVERRPRRNSEGRVSHPSPVLHYRLRLPELLAQMRTDPESLKGRLEQADADDRTHRSWDSSTPIGTPEEADSDVRANGSGASGAPSGGFERAVTGAPYTEGTPEETKEATPEGTQEATPEETKEETSEGAGRATRRSAPRWPPWPPWQDGDQRTEEERLPKASPVPRDIIEMIQAAGDGRSEDEHLDAVCGLYEISTGQRERYRPYVRRALEELRTRNGAA